METKDLKQEIELARLKAGTGPFSESLVRRCRIIDEWRRRRHYSLDREQADPKNQSPELPELTIQLTASETKALLNTLGIRHWNGTPASQYQAAYRMRKRLQQAGQQKAQETIAYMVRTASFGRPDPDDEWTSPEDLQEEDETWSPLDDSTPPITHSPLDSPNKSASSSTSKRGEKFDTKPHDNTSR